MNKFPYKIPGPEDKYHPGRITPETLVIADDTVRELLQSIAENDLACEKLRGMIADLSAAVERLKTLDQTVWEQSGAKTVSEAELIFIQRQLEAAKKLLQEQEVFRKKTEHTVEEFRKLARENNLKFFNLIGERNPQN